MRKVRLAFCLEKMGADAGGQALVFQGVFVFASSFVVFGLRGVQARRVVDSA